MAICETWRRELSRAQVRAFSETSMNRPRALRHQATEIWPPGKSSPRNHQLLWSQVSRGSSHLLEIFSNASMALHVVSAPERGRLHAPRHLPNLSYGSYKTIPTHELMAPLWKWRPAS